MSQFPDFLTFFAGSMIGILAMAIFILIYEIFKYYIDCWIYKRLMEKKKREKEQTKNK